jgi:SAM-dependent methyltransferase
VAALTAPRTMPVRSPLPWWTECLARSPLRWQDGKALYTEVKSDIVPDTQEDVVPARWTNMRRHHHGWLARELAALPDGTRLLDIGCGQSQFRDLIGRFALCGIDHFPYPGADIVAEFSAGLPLQDRTVEAVMLSNVLEHIYEPLRLLAECQRVLRPGGQIFVVVPFVIKIHQAPYDFHRYTEFALAAMARDCGFVECRLDPVGNIFDVYDIDRWVRANLIRARTAGLRRFAARALIKIQNETERALQRILPSGLAAATDDLGFPQSYGMVARRPFDGRAA